MADGLFELGEIVISDGAVAVLKKTGDVAEQTGRLLARHHHGDWGDVSAHEKERNKHNLNGTGGLIESAYGQGTRRLYVITAADRSTTTIKTAKEVTA